MGRCLYCHEHILLRISWNNLVQLRSPTSLCNDCEDKLERIEGDRCSVCSRKSQLDCCYDCQRWKTFYNGDDPLIRNYSLYMYNDFMKSLIAHWKYRGDYVLGELFQQMYKDEFAKQFASKLVDCVVIPIPLSDERLKERGFNQAEVLMQCLNVDKRTSITRHMSEKQSKKTRFERMLMKNPFDMTDSFNKPVVLVDDIYTTGRTLRHAAQLLKESGCPQVYALTLCRA